MTRYIDKKFKIIMVDNYCREPREDVLVIENISHYEGEKLQKELNNTNNNSEIFYDLVLQDCKLVKYDDFF